MSGFNIISMKYKIYKLIHKDLGVVYVGRTKLELEIRKNQGRYRSNLELHKIYKECSIELIEETNDVSRERYWIDEFSKSYNLLNKRRGDTGLSRSQRMKVYNKENSDLLKEKKREYTENNKERIKEYQASNKERISQKNKEWNLKNREKRNAQRLALYYLKKNNKK